MPLPARLSGLAFAAFAGGVFVALLLVFMLPPGPFGQALPTAAASIVLLVSAVSSYRPVRSSVDSRLRGFQLGMPLAFFFRQIHDVPRLAGGAERMLVFAFLVWLVARGVARLRRQRV